MGKHGGFKGKHTRNRGKLDPATIFFIALALIVMGLAVCRVGIFYENLDVKFTNSAPLK